MKKITIGAMLLFSLVSAVHAQDYKKVRNAFILSQVNSSDASKLEAAKTELDKVLADPKAEDKAETYLLKAEILGTIAANQTLKEKYPDAPRDAFAALKKYLELEPGEEKLKADNYAGVNGIYGSIFNEGLKYYNDKAWDSAYSKFKTVAELGDIFTARKWSNSAFDTTSYLYAGVTAQNAKLNEDAARYYGKIAENKVSGQDYVSIYDFLTKYYLNEKKEAEFQKYLALAREVYPENTLWSDLEFANLSENYSVDDMLKKFNEGDQAKTFTSSNYLDYGDYFINDKKVRDLDDVKRKSFTEKAHYAFSKAWEMDTTNAIASFNAGVAAYSAFEDASDSARKIKGVTPAIKAQRAEADKIADVAADKSITWLERAYNSLAAKTDRSGTEKNVVGKAADILYNLYAYKKDRSKVIAPKDYDRFEAKATYYDSMHGKF